MKPTRLCCTLPLVMLLALPALAADKDDKEKKDDKEAAGEKLVSAGQLTGVLRAVGTDKFLTVQVQLKIVQPDLQAMANQLQDQLQILRAPPWQRPQLIRRMVQRGPRGLQVHTINRDVELEPAADMKVRVLQPQAAFDDKGNPKRYT